ncbi:MAG: hypothetical protein PUG67_00955 [Peptoniphilaceae bacterium]|nr:hypothetical protein [Peptoniphilaceae bacterium]MDY6018627.1 hypothetical protein [Anaerococcus sp.]
MNKYLKETLKFLFGFILIILAIFFVYRLHLHNIIKKNEEFAKYNTISYKQNVNRIEYEFSKNPAEDIQEETITDKKDKSKKYQIFYPLNKDKKLQPIFFSTDENLTYKDYEKSLQSLASFGFLVLVNEDSTNGNGENTYKAIETLASLNKDRSFSLKDKIDMNNIGLGGHGVGACEALNASYLKNNDSIKAIFLTSLPKMGTINNKFLLKNKSSLAYDMKKVNKPIFITAGSGKIDSFYCPLEALSENINSVNKNVEAYGAIKKKYDNNLVNNYHPLGYMNAWFNYSLKKDTTAANAFIVRNELKNNPSWAYVKDNR